MMKQVGEIRHTCTSKQENYLIILCDNICYKKKRIIYYIISICTSEHNVIKIRKWKLGKFYNDHPIGSYFLQLKGK